MLKRKFCLLPDGLNKLVPLTPSTFLEALGPDIFVGFTKEAYCVTIRPTLHAKASPRAQRKTPPQDPWCFFLSTTGPRTGVAASVDDVSWTASIEMTSIGRADRCNSHECLQSVSIM